MLLAVGVALGLAVRAVFADDAGAQEEPSPRGLAPIVDESPHIIECAQSALGDWLSPRAHAQAPTTTHPPEPVTVVGEVEIAEPVEVELDEPIEVEVVTVEVDCDGENVARWLRTIVGLLGVIAAVQVAALVRPWLRGTRV